MAAHPPLTAGEQQIVRHLLSKAPVSYSSDKGSIYGLVKECWPQYFLPRPETIPADVSLIDALVIVRGLPSAAKSRAEGRRVYPATFNHLVQRCLSSIERQYDPKGRRARSVYFMFDQPQHVSIAKGPEQRMRRIYTLTRKLRDRVAAVRDGDATYQLPSVEDLEYEDITGHTPLPDPWDEVWGRRRMRKAIMRYLSRRLLFSMNSVGEGSEGHVTLPETADRQGTFAVVGHGLTNYDLFDPYRQARDGVEDSSTETAVVGVDHRSSLTTFADLYFPDDIRVDDLEETVVPEPVYATWMPECSECPPRDGDDDDSEPFCDRPDQHQPEYRRSIDIREGENYHTGECDYMVYHFIRSELESALAVPIRRRTADTALPPWRDPRRRGGGRRCPSFRIVSTDTDTLCLTLCFLEYLGNVGLDALAPEHLRRQYAFPGPIEDVDDLPEIYIERTHRGGTGTAVDVKRLFGYIRNLYGRRFAKSRRQTHHPVTSYIMSLYARGSDYECPLFFVTHKRFHEAIETYATDIGPLIVGSRRRPQVYVEAYQRLIYAAYYVTYRDRMIKRKDVSYRWSDGFYDGALFEHLRQDIRRYVAGSRTNAQLRLPSNANRLDKLVPDTGSMLQRIGRLSYHLLQMLHSFETSHEAPTRRSRLVRALPTRFGYSIVDVELASQTGRITGSNIFWARPSRSHFINLARIDLDLLRDIVYQRSDISPLAWLATFVDRRRRVGQKSNRQTRGESSSSSSSPQPRLKRLR